MKALGLSAATAICLVVGSASTVVALHAGHGKPGYSQPYAGQQSRVASSLSPEEVEGLLAGRGMGFARPAELNGHPGPMHVLELAADLKLTEDQRAKIQAAFDRMLVRATAAGAAYVAAEQAVDAAFRSGADRDTVFRLVREADLRRADKRLAHLEAHLEVTQLLTVEQRKGYAKLRGYGH